MSLSKLRTLPRVCSPFLRILNPRINHQSFAPSCGAKFYFSIAKYSSTSGSKNPQLENFKEKFRKDKVMTIPNGLCLLRWILYSTDINSYMNIFQNRPDSGDRVLGCPKPVHAGLCAVHNCWNHRSCKFNIRNLI